MAIQPPSPAVTMTVSDGTTLSPQPAQSLTKTISSALQLITEIAKSTSEQELSAKSKRKQIELAKSIYTQILQRTSTFLHELETLETALNKTPEEDDTDEVDEEGLERFGTPIPFTIPTCTQIILNTKVLVLDKALYALWIKDSEKLLFFEYSKYLPTKQASRSLDLRSILHFGDPKTDEWLVLKNVNDKPRLVWKTQFSSTTTRFLKVPHMHIYGTKDNMLHLSKGKHYEIFLLNDKYQITDENRVYDSATGFEKYITSHPTRRKCEPAREELLASCVPTLVPKPDANLPALGLQEMPVKEACIRNPAHLAAPQQPEPFEKKEYEDQRTMSRGLLPHSPYTPPEMSQLGSANVVRRQTFGHEMPTDPLGFSAKTLRTPVFKTAFTDRKKDQ